MAIHFSNSTTERLEGFGRARGLEGFGVIASRDNAAGVYFVARFNGRTLSRWISLGWSVSEAKEAIERLATRGEEALTPSATGYSYSV
jgi:hypothetical protein